MVGGVYGSGTGPSLNIGTSVTAARPDAFDRNCLVEMRGTLDFEDTFRTAIWRHCRGTASLFTLVGLASKEGQFLAAGAILVRANPPSILNVNFQTSARESLLRAVYLVSIFKDKVESGGFYKE